ncbi:MAG: NAD(P)(+) transhydrogenase (Re/Si-specific) subunit beta [Lawsonella sp.]|uniref:NAD(P)(+) transhydrogenase (Re/Si-specific) subunit beta n=1 Tax=Lawsonella sp. TaxID=2041415 RepID=UPI0025D1EDC4|nr:NAD(P)(+) transhydrogenase (Re/Si-specific) subunit beta [Lawsonella sp.]MDY2978772.1 NAD(P)(+) transhydrogenase (Re/Si-specific) subunit beta [Lawsonella sp.]
MTIAANLLYIVAFVLFIYGLSGLTGPSTAVRGNKIAAVGMVIAFVGTILKLIDKEMSNDGSYAVNWILIVVGLIIGTAIAVPVARKTKMTEMPQLVAMFNGLGGGTVGLIALTEAMEYRGFDGKLIAEEAGAASSSAVLTTTVIVGSILAAIIGSISFWGSIVAFAKLQGLIPGRPIGLGKAQQIVNAVLFIAAVAFAIVIGVNVGAFSNVWWMLGIIIVAAILGLMLVLPIGGADMPVVISLLNAMTGLSAAAAGLAINNTAMIVAGMIVGASGTILTNLMAKAMNRSVLNIVAGGFGGDGAAAVGGAADRGPVKSTSAADVAIQMAYANEVIVVPGYGMAVAQAQHAVKEMAALLAEKGVPVKYAIHPVAGRMPGHMNVLLAEAGIDYDAMKEMDEINGEFSRCDVALVIGANDVTNPAAKEDPSSPIYGMPVLNVADSHSVIVSKRSMNSGYAGIDNPLFYLPQTSMLFGDAKDSVDAIVEELKGM